MMTLRDRLVLAGCIVGLTTFALSAFAQAPAQPPEPVFQGKPLSEWLKGYPTPESEEALRQAGSNAIPILERLIRETDQDPMPPDEPIYQGKRLTQWLLADAPTREDARDFQVFVKRHKQIAEAVQAVGTNAIPTLLRLLRTTDSTSKTKLLSAWGALARSQVTFPIDIDYTSATFWIHAGRDGFSILDPKAQSAVPALVDIINQNISATSRSYTMEALAHIGPAAREAVPCLLTFVTNAVVTRTDAEMQLDAITALGQIHADPDRVVPALIDALHSPNHYARVHAMQALPCFGPDAKRAVPALFELYNTPDNVGPQIDLRMEAARALKLIDPEAADKAGVK
jgi:hypothetical protein